MRTAHAPLALVVTLTLVTSALAADPAAKPAAKERELVYVDDIGAADKALAVDATALTTALCAALSKDKRLDVICAPDVKQILNFAATASMIGSGGGQSNAIEERLAKAKHVVQGTYRKDGSNFVLVIKAGPRSAGSTSTALYTEKPVVALEEKADQQKKLLDRLPADADKITAGLLAPPPSAPPAPLK